MVAEFWRASLLEWKLGKISNKPGEVYGSSYLQNAIGYIENNRIKHRLSDSKILREIIQGFVVSMDEAYRVE